MKHTITSLALLLTLILAAQSPITKEVGEFKELKVFDLINVTMIKSDENKVVITGANRRDVEIINKNEKLKIRMDIEEYYNGNDIDVTLYYTSIETIDANEGAQITVKDPLEQFEIEFKAQEGGDITAAVKSTYTYARAVTGGIINLSGTSKNQDISILTGGECNSQNLITESSEVSIIAGGEATIHASAYAEVKIKAGGDVYIYGNPKEINEKRVLGGRVKRM